MFVKAQAASNWEGCQNWTLTRVMMWIAHLKHGIVPTQELDKARHNATLDNAFNRGVFFF